MKQGHRLPADDGALAAGKATHGSTDNLFGGRAARPERASTPRPAEQDPAGFLCPGLGSIRLNSGYVIDLIGARTVARPGT